MAQPAKITGSSETAHAGRQTAVSTRRQHSGSSHDLPLHDAPPLQGPARPVRAFSRGAKLAFSISVVAALVGLMLLSLAAGPSMAAIAAAAFGIAGLGLWQAFKIREDRLRAELAAMRMRAEEIEDEAWELKESEERYRSMAQAFGDMVAHRDPSGKVLFVNDALAKAFGGKPEDFVGKGIDPRIAAQGKRPRGETGNGAHAREISLATPNGKRWFKWIDIPMRDESSGHTAIRSVARDITDHKLAEQALENARQKAESANTAKTRFLATVSHEMRTPLNGILGMSRLLAGTTLTPEQTAYNDAIHSSGSSLYALIEDMLDLTRIEAGHFEKREEDFSPGKMVEEVCELIADRAHEKGIDIAAVVSSGVPETVRADAGRIRQVLVNLVGNAVKFTEKGGVTIRLHAQPSKPGKSSGKTAGRTRLAFSVTDTGPGISEADAKRIFGEFVQADSATTRKHGGAGLGLSISQGIVRRLGGEITVKSRTGEGAEFGFELDAPVIAAGEPADANPLAGRHVLIISPGEIEGPAIAETIEGSGGRALCTKRLGEAKRMLRGDRQGFDTIIMDAAVSRDPVVSLQRLKAGLSQGRDPYSIVAVQPGSREHLPERLRDGFDAYLVRPVRRASLLRVLAGETNDGDADRQRPATTGRPLLRPGEKLARHEILLAEDNEINALLVRTVLERAGQSVTHAATGRDAVAAFRKAAKAGQGFDLVLTDLHMPVMDGTDAIAAIRAFEKKSGQGRAKVMTLSADEQAGARAQSRKAGADGFLSKPIDPAALVDILRGLG